MPWFRGFGPDWGSGYPFPYRFCPWPHRPRWGWPCYAVPWWGAHTPLWGMATPEAELPALRAQADWLRGELEAIERRIEELETAE